MRVNNTRLRGTTRPPPRLPPQQPPPLHPEAPHKRGKSIDTRPHTPQTLTRLKKLNRRKRHQITQPAPQQMPHNVNNRPVTQKRVRTPRMPQPATQPQRQRKPRPLSPRLRRPKGGRRLTPDTGTPRQRRRRPVKPDTPRRPPANPQHGERTALTRPPKQSAQTQTTSVVAHTTARKLAELRSPTPTKPTREPATQRPALRLHSVGLFANRRAPPRGNGAQPTNQKSDGTYATASLFFRTANFVLKKR